MDGEATEDVLRELSEPPSESEDPEVQFAIAALFAAPFAGAGAPAAHAAELAAGDGLQAGLLGHSCVNDVH